MRRPAFTCAVASLALSGFGSCKLIARQTTFDNSSATTTTTTTSPGTTSPIASLSSVINACPDQGGSSPCYVCGGVYADTIGLNSWYSKSYNVTVATIVQEHTQYNNTVILSNKTMTVAVANATDIYGTYAKIAGGTAPTLSGVPTNMAIGDGGSTDYAATVIMPGIEANLRNQTQIMSPSAWLAGPGVMFIEYTIISAGTASSTTAYNFIPDIDVYVTANVPSGGWSGSERLPMPTEMKSAILQANLTLSSTGMPLSLCSAVGWSMGGEPTVHIPVNQLTVTSGTTSTTDAVFGTISYSKFSSSTPPAASPATKNSESALLPSSDTLTDLLPSTTYQYTGSAVPAIGPQASSQGGYTISITTSGTEVIVNGQTTNVQWLSSSSTTSPMPSNLSLVSVSALVIADLLLLPGQSAILSGTTYLLLTSGDASSVLVNGTPTPLPPSQTSPIAIGGITATPTAAPALIVASSTLLPGASATIAGSTYSVDSDIFIVNGQTQYPPPLPSVTIGYVIAPVTPTLVSGSSAFVISGQTLQSGSKITVAGGEISIASNGAPALVVGNSAGSSTSNGLGGAIMSGLSVSSQSSAPMTSHVATPATGSRISAAAGPMTTSSAGVDHVVVGNALAAGVFVALAAWL